MATRTYPVTGMTCAHCVAAVRSELSELPGVVGVEVDLRPDDISTVQVTSESALDDADVAAAVNEAGYHVASGSP